MNILSSLRSLLLVVPIIAQAVPVYKPSFEIHIAPDAMFGYESARLIGYTNGPLPQMAHLVENQPDVPAGGAIITPAIDTDGTAIGQNGYQALTWTTFFLQMNPTPRPIDATSWVRPTVIAIEAVHTAGTNADNTVGRAGFMRVDPVQAADETAEPPNMDIERGDAVPLDLATGEARLNFRITRLISPLTTAVITSCVLLATACKRP